MSTFEPLPPGVAPFAVGEKVAFAEDHAEVPGMYGIVRAVGLARGQIVFEVSVIDPETRVEQDPPLVRRVTLEEVQ